MYGAMSAHMMRRTGVSPSLRRRSLIHGHGLSQNVTGQLGVGWLVGWRTTRRPGPPGSPGWHGTAFVTHRDLGKPRDSSNTNGHQVGKQRFSAHIDYGAGDTNRRRSQQYYETSVRTAAYAVEPPRTEGRNYMASLQPSPATTKSSRFRKTILAPIGHRIGLSV